MQIGSVGLTGIVNGNTRHELTSAGREEAGKNNSPDRIEISEKARKLQQETIQGVDKFESAKNINKSRLKAIKCRVDRGYYSQPRIGRIIVERLLQESDVLQDTGDVNSDETSDTRE